MTRTSLARTFTALLLCLFVTTTAAPARAAAPTDTTAPATAGIWLVSTSQTSFDDSISMAVTHYGRQAVADELRVLSTAAATGVIQVPDHAQSTSYSAPQLSTLANAVTNGTTSSISPNLAESWPIRGSKGSGSTFWTGMPLDVDGTYCNVSCTLTDRLSINSVVTNPGAIQSKITYTLVYSPNGGHFTNNFERAYALCYGTDDCGHTDTGNPGSHTAYVDSSTYMNGNKLRHGHELFGHFTPYGGQAIVDMAKTALSTCAITTNVCKY